MEGSSNPQPDPVYSSNAEEADTMIWLHASKTQLHNILVLSPDTEVYMIGLPLQCSHSKHIIVQISKIGSHELKLLCTKTLIQAIANDPTSQTSLQIHKLQFYEPSLLSQVVITFF